MLQRGTQERASPQTTAGGLALVVVVMLVVVLLGNWTAKRLIDRHRTNFGYAVIDHKWMLLQQLDAPVDWVVLGDSSVSQGLSVAALEAQTGERGLNLGTIGAFGLSDDLWMLREYVERFGPPKRVLIVHAYDVWSRQLRRDLIGRIPRPWALESQMAERYGIDLSVRRDILLNRYAPIYAERASLRRTLKIVGQSVLDAEAPRGLVEPPQLLDNGSVRACGADPVMLETDARSHRRMVRSHEPQISADNRDALLAIARLAREEGFVVHIIPGPIYDELLADASWAQYFAAQTAQLEQLLRDHPEVRVLTRPAGIPKAQLQSVDHITCEFMEDYTRWVIEQVEPSPASP